MLSYGNAGFQATAWNRIPRLARLTHRVRIRPFSNATLSDK